MVLEDPGMMVPNYVAQWHVFLPSDMLLGLLEAEAPDIQDGLMCYVFDLFDLVFGHRMA